MKQRQMILAVLTFTATLFGTACGTGAGGVCGHANQCGFIDDNEVAECKKDINRAVKKGDVDPSEVRECRQCANENGCGFEFILSCLLDCDKVWPHIEGSGF